MSKNQPAPAPSPKRRINAFFLPMEFFSRLKRIKPLDPLRVVVFFLLTVVCFVFCFFFLDYKVVARGLRLQVQSERLLRLGFVEDGRDVKRAGFLDGDCDLFDGDWVWDEKYPLYKSVDCPFMDEGFRCSENGRPDDFYTKWRWQPRRCNLPRFSSSSANFCLSFTAILLKYINSRTWSSVLHFTIP